MGKNLTQLGLKPKGKSVSKKDFNLMKQVFIGYDKDHDGTVTYKEFAASLAEKEGLLKSAAGMFSEMDTDGDGEMTFAELLKAFYPACSDEDIANTIKKFTPKKKEVVVQKKVLTDEQREELEAVCQMWDKDKDGTVSRMELRDSCQNLGIEEETIDQWFSQYDDDKNGDLDYSEVIELLKEVWE